MKRIFSLILVLGLIVALCSVSVLAVEYNTTESGEIPFEMMDLTNGTYVDYMNGASSEKGIGISSRYFKTTTNSCCLNVCEVDTNGVQGTVTFTVKNKENGEIIKDANGLPMVYSFTSDSKGSLASADVKEIVFSTPTPFYFEISTSNPTSTRCYGHYVVTEGPLKEITANAYLEGKVKNLIELGIVEGDLDGNLRLNESITRAEFTKVICKALNAAPAPTSVASYFSDVDANFWAFGYIETARRYGLIKGYGDDPYHPTFKPYNNITYSESFKMVVEMLGYGLFAEDLGGFPDGYKTVALQDLELFRAFVPDYSAPITRGELFEIVYNALDVPIVEVYHRTNREFKIMNGAYDDTPLKTLRKAFENRQQKINAENLSYTQIEDLQKQVDEGHYPWRLEYEQVIKTFISGLGENVENGELVSFSGDGTKCSGTYIVGNNSYLIELFKPIDKSEHGIWVVRSCEKTNKEVLFYERTPEQSLIEKSVDGWYTMPRNFIATFPFFENTKPKSVAAIYTLAGTEMEDTSKEIAKISAPYSYQTIAEVLSMEIDLPYESIRGHLQFEFEFEDGSIEKTEYYKIYQE